MIRQTWINAFSLYSLFSLPRLRMWFRIRLSIIGSFSEHKFVFRIPHHSPYLEIYSIGKVRPISSCCSCMVESRLLRLCFSRLYSSNNERCVVSLHKSLRATVATLGWSAAIKKSQFELFVLIQQFLFVNWKVSPIVIRTSLFSSNRITFWLTLLSHYVVTYAFPAAF